METRETGLHQQEKVKKQVERETQQVGATKQTLSLCWSNPAMISLIHLMTPWSLPYQGLDDGTRMGDVNLNKIGEAAKRRAAMQGQAVAATSEARN